MTPVSTEPQTATSAEAQTVPDHSERRSSDWDVRNAPKNYLSLVAAHGGTAFFSFASVWLVTRYLGSDGYGSIVALVAASQLVQIFLNWSSTSLARFGIEEFVETGKITHSFWSRTFILIPNLLLVVFVSGLWLGPVAGWLKIPQSVVWLIIVHLIITSIWLHVQYALQGVKMLRLQGALLAVERALTFAGLLALAAAGRLTLFGAVWCYILPAAVLIAAGITRIRPFVSLRGIFDTDHLRKMLVFSLPLIPFAVVGYLSTSQLDAFFITRYLSTHDLGIYAVASQMNGLVMQLPILANTLLLSMFVSLKASGQESLLQKFFRDAVPSITLFWSAACVALAVTCVFLIPLVFGRDFAPASSVLWVLVTASVTSFPVMVGFATLSNAYSRTYISMYASIGTAAANLIFDILLIPRYGMIGCAWATVLSALVNLCVFYVLLRKGDLIARNWIFVSMLPIVAGALAFSFGSGELIAVIVFVLLLVSVAYLHSDSVRYAVQVIKVRFNVKNVPPEPSLR